jgi:hypothetical protein
MGEELNEQSTKEEVSAYVAQVAKEVEADREGQKDDVRLVVEHADNEHKETPAATGGDTARKGDDAAQAGTGKQAESWMDDDLKAEIAAYGIGEDEIADFASREELDRALRLFDKSALEAGRKSLAESDAGGRTRNEKGQFAKQPEPKAEPEDQEGRYKVGLDTEVYGQEIVDEFTRMRDHYESRLEALEAHFASTEVTARERRFDQLVDALGHPDLFGKTDNETAKEKQRREDLLVEVETYLLGRASLGRPAEMNDVIVSRLARSLFADELGKKEWKSKTQKIARQSNGRMGGGATRPQDPREDPRDEFDRLYRQLEGKI